MFHKDHMKKRLVMCVIGLIITSMSVALFKNAVLGVDPFQSVLAGFDCLLPLSFSWISFGMNMLILIFTFFLGRHYIGIGTLINLLLSGYIIQFTTEFLQKAFTSPSIGLRIVFLILGIVIMCFASSLYITADLGVSSYDSVALMITEKHEKWHFRYVRICTDFICVLTGLVTFFISGGKFKNIGVIIGAGTIVTAFFMGPLLELFRTKIAEPMLYGKKRK